MQLPSTPFIVTRVNHRATMSEAWEGSVVRVFRAITLLNKQLLLKIKILLKFKISVLFFIIISNIFSLWIKYITYL